MTTYISGAQVTTIINSAERKVDIIPEIMYLEEDLAPLVHLTMGKGKDGLPIRKRETTNPEFKMLEKQPHDRWTAINYSTGYTAGAVTLVVDDVSFIPVGAMLKVVGGEMLYVTAKDSGASTITVTRSAGPTAAATLADNTPLYFTGGANEEFGAVPESLKVMTRTRLNYTQIFRTSIPLSRTLMNSELYGGKKRSDLRKEGWLDTKKDVELAFIFNEPWEGTGPDGYPIRTTGGVHYWLTAAGSVSTIATTLTKSGWLTFLRNLFRYGSRRKVVLCAPLIIDAIEYWKDGKLEFRPSDEVYNLHVAEFVTGHGTALIVRDTLLENSPVGSLAGYGGMALGLDIKHLGYRYLTNSDFSLYENVKRDGRDGVTDEILGEVGLHIELPEAHRILTGVTEYS